MAAQPTPLVSLIRVLNQIAAELHLQQIPEISVVAEARQLRQRCVPLPLGCFPWGVFVFEALDAERCFLYEEAQDEKKKPESN